MLAPQDIRWPLSAAQQGIWLGQQIDPASPLYNVGECIEILGMIDPILFEAAVRQTVMETEALHMRFLEDKDGPRQVLDVSPEFRMHLVDISAEPDARAAVEAWARADLKRTIDLSHGPLFTEALFAAAPDRHFWYQGTHHIALDGFGFSLITRRVAEIYTARLQNKPWEGRSCEGSPFNSMRKVIEEDLAYHASEDFERDRAFWSRHFADRPEPISLSDRSALASQNTVRQTAHLSPSSMERLQKAARYVQASWPDLIIAAIAAYLHRLTDAPEVILGLPVMGRLGSVSLRIPSMVMNIVPLRVPVHSGASLHDLVREVVRERRAIRPHMRYRYEQLRRDLKMVGGSRRLFGPVVNIMPFDSELRFAGQPAFAYNISAGPIENLAINVYSRSDGRGSRIDFDANPTCYSDYDIVAHQRRFLDFLELCASVPDQPIAQTKIDLAATLASPPRMERRQYSATLDGERLNIPVRSVVDLIVERARELPYAVALEHGSQRVSYSELERVARRIAASLAALGAGPDKIVAVLLPRSVDAILAILGVLFSGAGYLPLDPHGAKSRTATILGDAKPVLLITALPYAEQVESPSATRVVLLDQMTRIDELDAPAQTAEGNLAYVIYTSGSTGRPNGVMISHSSLAHFVTGATHCYGLRRDDRVLQFAPLHFDASIEEIFLTLCAGATLILRTDEMLESTKRFFDACIEHGITVLDLPTAFWHELAYSVSTGTAHLPPSIHTIIIGGEAALSERVARWRAAVGLSPRLLNTYGPTEATVVATFATLSGGDEAEHNNDVPIGRPLPGVRAAIIDAHGRFVDQGAVGELHLIGPGLARGYLGNSDLDTARFVALDQLPDHPRAYRTGDLVRQRDDGQLVFVGRVDDELKISGQRVDPSETETTLLRYPGVREAAVVGHVLADGIKRLSAYIVADDPAPTATDLRKHARFTLPATSIPSSFVFVDRLPKISSGKINRAALSSAHTSGRIEPVLAPLEGLERIVLQVWEQVLGVNGVSAHDDFFDLGGQSLQAIQVANRLSVALERDVPVAMVFRHTTIASLSSALEQTEGATKTSGGFTEMMSMDSELSHDIVPLSASSSPSPRPLRQIVLTGATGFVGVHLLRELLTQTDAHVTCFVRAIDARQAAERIRRAMDLQRVSTIGLDDRVTAVPADLSLPRFGLTSEEFNRLSEDCDAIYHNAAIVSVVRDYRSLRAANVLGTREILRLASASRVKPLHYVSTLAVAPELSISPEIAEVFAPPHPGLRDGYKQSKWVAERLMEQASERGLPVSVYRLGRVVGAPETGVVNENDLVFRLLRAGIPAGVLPDLDVTEAWTPVDYVGRAVVRLSLARPAPGTVFNLAPAPQIRLTEIFQWVRDYGYSVEQCSVPAWRARLASTTDAADRATLAFFDLQPGITPKDGPIGLGHVRCENVLRGLLGSGVECPSIDQALLHHYLDHCVETGWLPPRPAETHGRS